MRSLAVWAGLCALAPMVWAGEPLSDREVWNEGVGYYEAGDVTNALRVLRPLMLSRNYGARAAEVVAKLEHDRGNVEEAAVAAQIALRAKPTDARANRNFTRAADGVLDARETKHVNAVLAAAKGKDPGAMLQAATADARRLLEESGTYRTNAAERAVALADALAKRAEALADVWIPVREVIAGSVTNEEQAATILAQVNAAQEKTKAAARLLGDFDGDAYGRLSDVEHDFTRFLKLTVLPPAAIAEGIVAQSNAWQDAETVNGRAWQPDALDYTRAFRQKFPAWARAYEQQAQSDTNRPPFSAEDQAKVSALSTELEKIQLECCEKHLPPNQEQALGILHQIRDLLPKDKNGGGGGQQNSQNQGTPPKPDGDQDSQPPQDGGKDQPQDSPSDERQEQEPEQQEAPPTETAEPKDEPSPEDKEIEALLKKAQERNDEHEADKKARMRKAPLPPNERDW